jgi:predicted metal-dependent HD superfamily phosphohydrolase
MLKETFSNLLNKYTASNQIVSDFWAEIEQHYTAQNRHYHTLLHLENILQQLTLVKNELQDWDTILFSLFYHDIIYYAPKSDNEAQSAALAVKRMSQISVPQTMIDACEKQILATKSYQFAVENDTNYFTDADLSILGQPMELYVVYTKQIRKEYAIFPDFVYNPGREKVLNHFLNMEKIYKTDYFYQKFERQAKENIYAEFVFL